MDVRLLWLALGAFAGSVESSLIVVVMPEVAAEVGVSVADAGWTYTRWAGPGTDIASACSMRPALTSSGWSRPANSGRPEPRALTELGCWKPGPLSDHLRMNW